MKKFGSIPDYKEGEPCYLRGLEMESLLLNLSWILCLLHSVGILESARGQVYHRKFLFKSFYLFGYWAMRTQMKTNSVPYWTLCIYINQKKREEQVLKQPKQKANTTHPSQIQHIIKPKFLYNHPHKSTSKTATKTPPMCVWERERNQLVDWLIRGRQAAATKRAEMEWASSVRERVKCFSLLG